MAHSMLSYTEMLSRLVAQPSVSCTDATFDQGNLGVVEELAEWLSDLGFSCHLMPIPNQPNKANLIARLGDGEGGLVLSGHTDTVPCDPERWQSDPFVLANRDNKLFGLGATDMKGFFPLAMQAAHAFRASRLREPLYIVATADEESSMSGAIELLAQQQPLGRFAVIGEPTDMRPIRLHKGMMMEALKVVGRSGHSSDPDLGINALEGMQLVMAELLQYRAELQAKHRHAGFDVPVPTLNLGCIHGGDNPNRICGECELHFDLRPLPGMIPEQLRADINERMSRLGDRTGYQIEHRSLFPGLHPFEEPADSAIVVAAEEICGSTPGNVAFATESPFLQQLGMGTIVMGPGSINQAHQPDEYIDLAQIEPGTEIISQLIQRFCVDSVV